jgi:serine/threonine-protein kinase HipA
LSLAAVHLWGERLGGVSLDGPGSQAIFEYDPRFAARDLEPSPRMMPVRDAPYQFPGLAESFRGVPGLISDSLPDDFGNAVIDAWLREQGRPPESLDAVERLCYIGTRGMGALEFQPAEGPSHAEGEDLQVAELVRLADRVLNHREELGGDLSAEAAERTLRSILSVGISPGGARAKAVIAYNAESGQVRSGQLDAPAGFDHWLLKFDGVDSHRELGDGVGYGVIEYVYSRMARDAGIHMTECRLLDEGERRHFMTRRFDRQGGEKLHMQSLAALGHYDFKQAGLYSYEEALELAAQDLGLSHAAQEQLVLRALFNIMGRNQDDHVKNIAFLMNQEGQWALAPAFDVTYAYNPSGVWTAQHQMTLAGKRRDFSLADVEQAARGIGLGSGRVGELYERVRGALGSWPKYAGEAGLTPERIEAIEHDLFLELPIAG